MDILQLELITEMNELEQNLSQIHPASARADVCNALAWRWRYRRKEDALRLAHEACRLSKDGEPGSSPYHPGLAGGLAICGLIQVFKGDLDNAIYNAFQALKLVEKSSPLPAASDAANAISWAYIYMGDHASAMRYASDALRIAGKLNDRERQAQALDTIGIIYGKQGEHDQGLDSHQQALNLAADGEMPEVKMLIFSNLSSLLCDMERYSEAYMYSLKAIELANGMELYAEEIVFHTVMAEILTRMGNFPAAKNYLTQGIEAYNQAPTEQPHLYIRLMQSMAGMYLLQKRYWKAEPFLTQALDAAEENQRQEDLMLCHSMLSEMYEKTHNYKKALEHYREYQALNLAIASAELSRSTAMAKTEKELELFSRERDKDLQLQHEISQRQQLEALLEEMSIRDSLTGAFNRRHIMNLAQNEYERALRYAHPFCVMLVDVDRLKQINQQHGQAAGDQLLVKLAEILQKLLRSSDFTGRYEGDVFMVLLPETTSSDAVQVGERIRRRMEDIRHQGQVGDFSATVSIGLEHLFEDVTRQHAPVLEGIIYRAAKALQVAKGNGGNQVTVFHASN